MKTQREFFAALEKCRNGWVINRGAYPQSSVREIRHGSHCPITAVVESEIGVTYHDFQYETAAEAIGLPHSLFDRIVIAADWNNPSAEPRLRKRILAALGLSE